MRRQIWCIAVFMLVLATSLSAQTSNAIVSGRVSDPSGAVIPGATVSIQNKNTNVVQSTISNSDGLYSLTGLIPGTYSLAANVNGFKRFEYPNILLQVGDHIALDVLMQIGSSAESVTVTEEAPLLRTEDAQEGLVIDQRRILELPQYSRDPLAFAQLAPNVNGSSPEASYGNDFRINGGRTNQAEYFLDGQPVTTGYYHDIPSSTPSIEALGEFKILTNGLPAEYGRLSGGAVLLVTRSGSNEFHGGGYEFFKNDLLNANSWNSNRLGEPIGVFHDNVFGFTLGGPATIPKLYRGKNKTFFFVNYEGTRHVSGSNSNLASVPTALEKQGDFSQSLEDNGYKVQIYDPLTGYIGANGQLTRNPFPGELIPANRVDPLSKIFMGYYPSANIAPLPNTTNQDNYVYTTTSPANNNRWTGRLDQNWNASNTTHFSLSQYAYDAPTPSSFSALQPVGLNTTGSYTAGVEHDWIMNPTTIFTFRLGAVRDNVFSGSTVNVNDSNWGLPANVVDLMGGTNNGRVPAIDNMNGLNSLGGGSIDDIHDTAYTGSAAVQKIWGRHTFKAGYEHRRYYSNETTGGTFEMDSDRTVTAQSPSQAGSLGQGSMVASMLLGKAVWGDGAQMAGPASLQTYHGAYLQDDIKLSRKLTVNAGIRWDFEPPRTERFNRETFWDTNYTWNVQPDPGWSWTQVEQTIGMTLPEPEWMTNGIHGRVAEMGTTEYPGRTLDQAHPFNFEPRLAVAYQVLPKTVIRASYAKIYLTTTGNWFLSSARWNVGYGDSARLAQGGSPDGGLTYPLSFSNPMPNNEGYVPATTDVNALNMSVMGNWWLSETSKFSSGHEHDVQLAIQQELGSGSNTWLLEVSYNGTMGRALPSWIGVGEHVLPDAYDKIGGLGSRLLELVPNPFYGFVPAGSSRGGAMLPLGNLYELNPLWQQISTTGDPDGTSNYNAAYIQIQHRFAHGFGFLANYTFSKLMEDTGGIDCSSPGSGLFPQAGLGRGDVYSISGADFTHRVVFNYSVDLPFGQGRRFLNNTQDFAGKLLDKIAGGWTAAGVTTLHSGQYLGPTGTNSLWWTAGQANTGSSERPRFVYPRVQYDNNVSGHDSLIGSANSTPYMNRAAFQLAQALPNQLQIGDVGPVIPGMVGPGFSQWDFALMKKFGLGKKESRYLQLRFEAQNVFNHMNCGNPDMALADATFGMITSQNGTPRVAMIAAKIYF
ncbi:MAG: carboxypeptidase regulatory-like domain-containing protein [Bryobacteraceae bacterium]